MYLFQIKTKVSFQFFLLFFKRLLYFTYYEGQSKKYEDNGPLYFFPTIFNIFTLLFIKT